MKNITRKTDLTKRAQWRKDHASGVLHDRCHPVVRKLAFLLYTQPRGIVAVFKEAGVAPCMLHHWVSGKSNPQIPTITRLLDVLGMELTIVTKGKQ